LKESSREFDSAGTRKQASMIQISKTFSDLTRTISEGMPVFPGEPRPEFQAVRTIDRDGVNVTRVAFGTHTGTHVDAPNHFIAGSIGVDRIPFGSFVGEAAIVGVEKGRAVGVTGADLDGHSRRIRRGDIVLLYTGTSDRRGAGAGTDFSYQEPSAATWMVRHGIKCVGIDSFSVEKYGSRDGLAHKELLSNGIAIIENLSSELKKFVGRRMFLVCLPLLLYGLDAAPARAVLFEMADDELRGGAEEPWR
jgi:arylformamidase